MNVLEAAKALSARTPYDREGGCTYCSAECNWTGGLAHDADCPVPMLPRIVAALEAAEQLEALVEEWPDGYDVYDTWTEWSNQMKPKVEALVIALKGEAPA